MSRRQPNGERQWSTVTELIRAELQSYLAAAGAPEVQSLPTRCIPWTVRDLTAHLAITFRRFADMLAQSRTGDLSPPFARDELTVINLRQVERFTDDPVADLPAQAGRFLSLATDPAELMAHQRGPIPVGLQAHFALNELALHRHDLEEARGGDYRPADQVIAALLPIWKEVLGGLPPGEDDWTRILAASGRGESP